jgi:hypothetical protein
MLDSQEARFEEGDGRESGSVEGVVHFRRHCALNYCGLRMRVTIECVCSVVCTARRFSERMGIWNQFVCHWLHEV